MSNTITAYFKGRTGVAESVYQYDYGKVLVIDGLNLPATFEVHFTTLSEDNAITVIGQNNRVAIPDSCISITGTVTAYIYLHTGENDGETEYVVKFAVIRRARPVYDGTDEEKTELESAIQTAIAMLQNPKKVNNPLDEYNQVTYGEAGQLLRTKGNGSTEWSDVGLPTDAQTAQAVSDWLDEHPEATTTVQDHSLTYEKFVNGTLGYVTPDMFGAVGDGVTDDTIAVQSALDTRLPVRGTSGKIYYVSSNLTGYNNISDARFIFATRKMLIFTSVSDITINNCYFEMLGKITDLEDRGEYALAFTYCNNVHVLNNHFYHFTSNVICNVSSNIFVDGNYFYDSFQNARLGNGYGVVLQCCKMVAITNNHFKDVQRHSVYVSYSDAYASEPEFEGYNYWCENVTISNNIFEITDYDNDGYNRSSTEQQVKFIATKNANVENNQFIGTYGAVFFATEVEDEYGYCENIIINNNIIKNQVSDYRAIILELWQGANSPINKNISICGNVFQNTSKYPCIKLSKVDGLIISDNIASESSEYKTGFDYFCAFFHEGAGADRTVDCFKNIKISNNQITGRGLLKFYCDHDDYGIGIIDNIEVSNNNVNYSGASIMSYMTYTSINNFRLLNNVIKGATENSIYLSLQTNEFDGDNIYVIGNDLSGSVLVFGSAFAGTIYFLRNTNYVMSNLGLPTTSINDEGEYYVVEVGAITLPASLEVGNNELSVTFTKEHRVSPMGVFFVLSDSKFVPTYFGPLALKEGSLSATGFTAIVPKIANTSSSWKARYIAIGKH